MSRLRTTGSKFLRQLVKVAGGVILSDRVYDQLLSQRARAVAELVRLETATLTEGLIGVVLSKNRALQLYTLLHTYFTLVEYPAPIFIVYTATSDLHQKAYREVEMACQDIPVKVTFVHQGSQFRESLMEVLAQIRSKNMFFLVDDIVFIRKLNLDFIRNIDPTKMILSFRHSPHLNRSYTAGVNQAPPTFSSTNLGADLRLFNWFEQGNEWSDPWSVDGQILSTAEIRVLSRLCDFSAPNSYEGALKSFNDIAKNRKGLCYTESKILNLPINRVQSEVGNRSGKVSSEFLLEQWNQGLMLDTSMFAQHIPVSPHEEHSVRFKTRESLPAPIYQPRLESK